MANSILVANIETALVAGIIYRKQLLVVFVALIFIHHVIRTVVLARTN